MNRSYSRHQELLEIILGGMEEEIACLWKLLLTNYANWYVLPASYHTTMYYLSTETYFKNYNCWTNSADQNASFFHPYFTLFF